MPAGVAVVPVLRWELAGPAKLRDGPGGCAADETGLHQSDRERAAGDFTCRGIRCMGLSAMQYDWTIISEPKLVNGKTAFLCRCKCGAERVVLENNLKRGVSKNCGCGRREKVGAINRSHGAGAARLAGSRAASVWLDMHKRCRDKGNKNYGGRGIHICLDWCGEGGFQAFLRDMGEPPIGASIERVDNNAGYSYSNCRWAYPKDQQNNTRRNVHGWLNGHRMTAAQIADVVGQSRSVIAKQIKKGKYGQRKA